MKRAISILLVAVALGLLGYRFAHPDLVAFARDEPQFLAAAREQVRTGHWVSANPLYGNVGLRYGPTAFWFFGVVQLLFGDAPRTAIVAMGLLVTLSHLAFAGAVTRLFNGGAILFAVLVAFIASSPYEFMWSRLAWDVASCAFAFLSVAVLCASRELRPPHAIGLGVLMGLALSSHPMVTPFVLATGIALVWELRSKGVSFTALVALAGSMVLVNVPYLLFLLRMPVVPRTPRQPFAFETMATWLLEAPRTATTWMLEYIFDESWGDFQGWLGPLAGAVDALAVLAIVACATATVLGLAAAVTSDDAHVRRLGRIALLTWGGTVLLVTTLGLGMHPHYHFGAAWVPVFGVAAFVAALRRRSARGGAVALAVAALFALAQFSVVVQWMGYVRDRGGTRSPAYGTPLALQMEAMDAVCSFPERRIVLRNDTVMFRFPFEYLATTEPACRGKEVLVCATLPGQLTKPCPPPEPGVRDVRMLYASTRGGALEVRDARSGAGIPVRRRR
jgi:hypothetical protein